MKIHKPGNQVLRLVIPVDPVPASRPRVGRWGTYYGKTYTRWRDLAASRIPTGDLHLTGPLTVHVAVVKRRPKSTKLDAPKPDIDNFVKAVLDAVTKAGGYWEDDYQIVGLTATKAWAPKGEDGYTVVTIYEGDINALPKAPRS